jgi:peptide/nickel transport system substrate-binding protein
MFPIDCFWLNGHIDTGAFPMTTAFIHPTVTVAQPTVSLADPHILSDIRDRRSIIDSIYDALIRRHADGRFVPWLATQWQSSQQNRHWQFTLRQDVQFHNGQTLSAQDVVASLLRAVSPELPGELGTQGVLRSYFQTAQIQALSAFELSIEFQEPLADVLDLLVDIPIVPQSALDGLPAQAIGSGPYRVSHQAPGVLELTAFPEHWAGFPFAEKVIWIAEPDRAKRVQLVRSGMADIAVDAGSSDVDDVSVRAIQQPGYLCIIFLLNLFSGPLTDRRVRQAINYGIDRQALIADPDILNGQGVPLAGALSPKHGEQSPALAPYPYDPVRAKQLLVEAGYSQGLQIAIDLPERFPDESVPLARKIAEQLRKLDIHVDLTVHCNRPGYSEFVREKQFAHVACFDSSPVSAWRVFREKLDSRVRGPWWQGYHQPHLNALLDAIAQTEEGAVRQSLWQQANILVQDDAPWLFVYAPLHGWLVHERLQNWTPSIEGRVRLI